MAKSWSNLKRLVRTRVKTSKNRVNLDKEKILQKSKKGRNLLDIHVCQDLMLANYLAL
jgi:hypothetical protein